MVFDIRTLIILNIIITVINAGSIAIIWHQYRERFAGISYWLVSTGLQIGGLALLALRNGSLAVVTGTVAGTLLLAGALSLLMGLERFFGVKGKHGRNYLLLAGFAVAMTYSQLAQNVVMRECLMALVSTIINLQGCWLLLKRVSPELRPAARFTGLVFCGFIIVSLVKVILLLFPLQTRSFFQSGFVNSIEITLYIVLGICLTVSIILMVTRRLLEEVQGQEEKFTAAFHSSQHGILLTNWKDGTIIEVNDGFVNLTGFTHGEVLGKTMFELGIWVRKQDRQNIMDQLADGEEVQRAEFQFRKKSGVIMTGLFSASRLTINNESCILSSISDITELSHMKQQLQVMATHDYLTGLPNRRMFFDCFERAVDAAEHGKSGLALVSLDLDNFKDINDKLGHDIGDMVLVESAARMQRVLRKTDIAARFGGDEFVLLLGDIQGRTDAASLVDNILKELRQPYVIKEHQLALTASIGVAIYPEDGREKDELLKKSDDVMYMVKRQGRNGFRFYAE